MDLSMNENLLEEYLDLTDTYLSLLLHSHLEDLFDQGTRNEKFIIIGLTPNSSDVQKLLIAKIRYFFAVRFGL